tara:strand:+ start:115 stop:402 length:288 start_codon:yes stop_codon:yes gene_type:complete
MKKIKLSVAALLIAGMSYGQCTTNPIEEECKAIQYTIADLVDAIKMDIYYGRITREVGNYYLGELNKLQISRMFLVNNIKEERLLMTIKSQSTNK